VDHIEISNDPNTKRSIELYRELEDDLKGKVITISAGIDEIRDNMDFLAEKKTIIWVDAKTPAEAREAVAVAREIGIS
jgi:hypothetical protein